MLPLPPNELPRADEVQLLNSTAVERIYAAHVAEANGGPGVAALSPADRLTSDQMDAAYALLLNYHTFEQAWPLLAHQFSISRSTCYRRLQDAQNMFGDLKKTKKEGRKAVLIEFARKILQLCLTQRPPDTRGALAAMKFEASIAGLNKADDGSDGGPGSGNTSYVINLSIAGKKDQTFDVNKLGDISDTDFELIQDAVSQNVFGVDAMAKMLKETRGEAPTSGTS